MLIYLDLDTNRLVIGPGNAGLVGGYATPRGSGPLLRVQPVSGGQLVALPAGFEITWTVKAADDWGGDILAYAEDFTQEAGTTVYSCAVNYETTALDTLLGIGGDEVESVALIAQLAWRTDPAAVWRPTQVVDLHLHNSVWRGVPGAPAITPDSFSWLSAALVNAAGISLTVDTEAETITIGLALTAGTGMKVTTDGGNKVVAQDLQSIVAQADQDFFGGDGVAGSFSDDDELTFFAEANSIYEVDIYTEFVTATDPAVSSGVDGQWALPSGASAKGRWVRWDQTVPSFTTSTLMSMSGLGGLIVHTGALSGGNTAGAYNKAVIVTGGTAGNVTLQMRSNFISLSEKHTRKAGSFLIARRIS